ncbi:MAG: flagellar biosynthesis protein FlhF [Candidatus Lambdaproteobacteria bacterium RIFOXYD1_FULL_56_27]|uniref:Flagellar biosynthesis protein FlhF n=1 Tax=Candidatus Lambdaproteobacteria bacterium RIFOXYD2_FULL_56_26 TaxID=1817773 RepID=A0A1F6GRE2_9PROT|nr:MAG: flagellar biosynthesis protein FlhF [Candidatus Lambdaproteobacteria bacterium RIFOXYC1_FULL_56_13]OGH00702.1 MAG: flagellar biosynthesis protein FlhF [Candidatus Lambdaproteobacteria bacterium RIFOXYD2_FULL_56_26]OGH07869.1 MAG: flagellar biosynthesis protein FlhF [Candidatus Lambdaproteobacteria bacterium RIFOXYD1_FULL_56_27]
MQVKKYIANDMQEAVRMIKEDLGSRAVILSTRKVRKGSGAFGLFGKYVLEVTAAKDEEKQKPAPKNFDGLANRQTGYAQSSASEPPSPPEPKREPMRTAGPTAYAGLQEDISELKDLVSDLRKGVRREVSDEANVGHLRYEIHELKQLVGQLVNQSGELRKDDLHENLIALYQQLCFNGVEEKFARKLAEEVQKKVPKEEIDNFSYVKIYLARMFMQVLKIDAEPTKKDSKFSPKVLTFLGPTGVGKTTTLAKIASAEKMRNPKLKIGLLTIDTYRIAAVAQLQEYARIIKVPCKVVNEPGQLQGVIEEFRDMDLILIDTAGRSQRDEMQMGELRDFFKSYDEFKNILVLSSTTKDADLVEITKRFSTVPLSGVIFTKLDESTNYGSVFNHAIRFKLPLTYLTTGQNVPDDIEPASRERLIDLLLNISGEVADLKV